MLGRLSLGTQSRRGRRFPEAEHPYRNDFQRDRDRIIHTRAFRRLEGKTQVFTAGLYDHFRNRLTHTIEVSQVARTVASALELNEEYTETLALAHDLGHPPFGHVGEKQLDGRMRAFGDRFEHNRHSLRIVDLLEQRYARFDGLNLTFEVREGIVKHSREIGPDPDPDLQELSPSERPPLEAQLIDLADEIAYNTADVDDAFSLGLFTIADIGKAVPLFAELTEQIETQFPGASDRVRFWEIQRQVMNVLIGGLVQGTFEAAEKAGVQTPDDVRALDYRLASLTPPALAINREIRALLIARVYAYPQLMEDRGAAAMKVGELFDYLVNHPDRLSPGYREHLPDTPVHRVVCDYIAGMTDAYFTRTYKTIFPEATPE